MALNKIQMVKTKPKPFRLLVVTFDLTDTVPGDRRYGEADEALQIYGEVFNPVKQLRLLITRSSSKRIRASLEQRIGNDTSILVAPLTSLPAWHIHGAAKRREWRRFVRALEDHGVQIAGLSSNFENPE